MAAFLNRIGTAVPPHDIHATFMGMAGALLPDPRARRLFARMAERCGIERRRSVFAPGGAGHGDGRAFDRDGFYRLGAFPGTAARMRAFEEHAPALALEAVAGLNLDPGERAGITHLIVATCTGFYAPGLDLQLAERLGLDPGVERTVVGFMGCYAAMNALKLARHIVRSEPAARVLMVNAELCTLHLRESPDLETVLSFLIFGDGASAGLVTAEPHGIALDRFRAVVIPGSADLITWRIGDGGFDMHLSGTVPAALAGGLPGALPDILDGRGADDVELWAVHPGGRTILDAVEQAAGLDGERLADSRAVLREFGNMSSATVMFVLKRMLDRFTATGIGDNGLGCAMAFGPGLTAETMTFRMAA
ncbi:type III polyketide synthase [Azospirillum halopraeferens]|uniref:type III polyketide synthase n=1 Tax=Azospirillum halopraeferens TaxID=34010 RepID=UPI000420454A|nr:type III polyketide synthase [Azospirillum halopraeferens]